MTLINPNWFERRSPRERLLILALGLILLIFAISAIVWVLSGGGKGKKEEQLETNIDRQIGINAVVTNIKTNAEVQANEATNQSNQATANFSNSVNRDSSTFTGNSTDKFCRRFPSDSSCRDWTDPQRR